MNKKIINIESVTFGIPNVICLKYMLTHSLNVILFATIIVENIGGSRELSLTVTKLQCKKH